MTSRKLIFGLVFLASIVLLIGLGSALVSVAPSAFSLTGSPGASLSQSLTLNNTNGSDYTFTLSSNPSGWTFPSSVVVPVNSTSTFNAVFQIPSNAAAGTTHYTITASSSDGTVNVSLPATIIVGSTPALTINHVQDLTLSQNGSVTVTNSGNAEIDNIVMSSSGDFAVSLSSSGPFNLLPGQTSQVINISRTGTFNSAKLTNTVTINASSNSPAVSAQIQYSINRPFCINGELGTNLSIDSDVSISNSGEGDDTDWRPLDDITIKATVNNDGSTDLSSVSIVLGLFDASSGVDRTGRLNFISSGDKKIDLSKVKSGDSKSGTFEFKLPGDMPEGNYNIIVKAYSRSTGESNLCADTSNGPTLVDVSREDTTSKFIAFDNVQFAADQVTCGDTATLTFDTVNIGDDQDKIVVHVFNQALGVDLSQVINQGLNTGDSQSMTFSFPVPQGVSNSNYPIRISSDYDYSSGNYHQYDTGIISTPNLHVIGCSGGQNSNGGNGVADVSASLQSDAVAGKELGISATITNLQNHSATFIVNPTGFDSWASLGSVSSKVVTLSPGQSKDVTIKLNVNSDASGSESLTIDATSNGQTTSQDVAVDIAKGSSLGGLFSGSALIWVIGLVNLVLIILIIVVAVRLSRK